MKDENQKNVSGTPPADVPPLKRGDQCQSITGGPKMMVTSEDGEFINCEWPYGTARILRSTVRRFTL